ncbi:hypothetical protein [Propionivibrio sp.]|uniref:hypothetical protein n=1 Tax=Propionivibrio sp. TaxID=2212460 RepID=UPI00272E0DBB|nr:hypothetical protein [Propionivibrio sp.]
MAKSKSSSSKLQNNILFNADISEETMRSMEQAATTQARGQQRRMCLAVCARSSDVIQKLMEESPEAFIETIDMIEAFHEHAQALVKVSESALARMILVGKTTKAAV